MDRIYDIKQMDAEWLKDQLRKEVNEQWFYVSLADCFRVTLEEYIDKKVDRRIANKLSAAIASSKDVADYGARAGVLANSLRAWYLPDGDNFRLNTAWEWHIRDAGNYTTYDRGQFDMSYVPRELTAEKCAYQLSRFDFHAKAIPALQTLLGRADHVVETYNRLLGALQEFHEVYIDDDLPGEIRRLFPLAGYKLKPSPRQTRG